MKTILENLNLEQYIQVFEDEGIEDVTTFNDYEDSDLEDLGLKKPHIKRLRRYFEEQTKEIKPLQEQTLWYQVLKNDKTLWNEKILSSNIPIVSHEYNRIYNLLENGQYFGVLLQIKDFFEILLKLPVLIVLNEKFNLKEYTQSEMNFILATLEKPLSLGHWHELATFIKKYTLDDSSLSELINNTIKLYNKHDIIKWRNDEIGHGALSLDDDIEFQEDIKSKLFLLKNFLDDNSNILISIYFDFDNNQVVYGTKKCSFMPFLKNLENKIYFFDSYLSRKQKVHQLNYCFGKKLISEVPDFDDFISKYEITKREQQLSSCKIEDVRLAEEEKQLDLLESSTDFISPTHLVTWLDNSMKNFQKGKFLLQMQRGTGKSIFCKALDQLSLNKIDFKDDIIVRGFYINDVFRNTLSDFTSEVSYFILNKKLDGKSFVDVFKGNLPNLNQDSTKSDFAYLLNWYKQKYDVEKLLLIIDGVDEIPQQSNKAIFDILPDEQELDEGVFLLITSRTDEEIITYTKEKLAKLEFQDKKIIQKNSKENIETLKGYINKFKLVADDSQIEDLIQKADYRIFYLNMLKDILLSCKINFEDIPSNEHIIDFYLLEIKKKYGEKYFQTIFDILIILASQLEELTIKEMALLNNDSGVSLKLIANLFDLRGFIKKTRNENGNKFSLNHILITHYLNNKFQNEIIEYLKNIYKNINSFNSEDVADVYKLAYLRKYENIYNISLSDDLKGDSVLKFLLNLNKCEIHKKVKIAILLYKVDINKFFEFIIEMNNKSEISLILEILEKLKIFGDTKNTIKIIELVVDNFDKSSEIYLNLYETMCDMTHLEGNYEKAANLLENLVDNVMTTFGKDSKVFIKYSIRIAHHRMFFSNIELPWNRMHDLAKEIDQNKYPNEYAEIMFMLGGNLAALRGNFKEGIEYLKLTRELGQKINDKYLLSRCMRKLSDYHRFYNDIDTANMFCEDGIKYTDDEVENRQRIYLYATQAENYRKLGQFDMAIEHFEQCKKYALSNNIKGWVANSMLGLSETYRVDTNKHHNNDYLVEALMIYEKINMNWGIIHTKIAMALNSEFLDKKLLNEALDLAMTSNYLKDIKYINELLKWERIIDIDTKYRYHELMFL